ncbi:sex comb on midleg-like protein 4 isoform X2 [Ornithorhynchus anatinus]|uniref:sex comb on midleg-like protein 4 isoform X2 n=1 Tax=Ornithorhynchus anatinus TaxID=9258 RepID=UPI0010A770A6|nr:sex comb on midleg-like protein 4 isoform X2 [Ornithorhynchus anatinus]
MVNRGRPVGMQSPEAAGRKRGRPGKTSRCSLFSTPAGNIPDATTTKRRGRKPGYKLKSRVLMTPLATSPPRGPREPGVGSALPGAATVSGSSALQTLKVCIFINKQAGSGPYLQRRRVQRLPAHFGPARPAAALQQVVQACIDCARRQKTVFSLVTQGYGRELVSVSASFDGQQHHLSLPVVNSPGYVLRFLQQLCRSLLCDDLFSSRPLPQPGGAAGPLGERDARGMEAETPLSGELENPMSVTRFHGDPAGSASGCLGSSPSYFLPGRLRGGVTNHSGAPASFSSSSSRASVTTKKHLTSSPMKKGTFLKENRRAASPSPDWQPAAGPWGRSPSAWTVDDVVCFVEGVDPRAFGPHAALFRKHEIDGSALLLLKSDMVMKYLGLKLGPALKLCYHIDKLKQTKF